MPRYLTLLLLAFPALLLTNCSKKDNTPSISYTMSAGITQLGSKSYFITSGAAWVVAGISDRKCVITGSSVNSSGVITSRFTFTLNQYAGPQSYPIGGGTSAVASYEVAAPAYKQTEFASGAIIITSATADEVTGTFTGTLTDSTVVANGTFVAFPK